MSIRSNKQEVLNTIIILFDTTKVHWFINMNHNVIRENEPHLSSKWSFIFTLETEYHTPWIYQLGVLFGMGEKPIREEVHCRGLIMQCMHHRRTLLIELDPTPPIQVWDKIIYIYIYIKEIYIYQVLL